MLHKNQHEGQLQKVWTYKDAPIRLQMGIVETGVTFLLSLQFKMQVQMLRNMYLLLEIS